MKISEFIEKYNDLIRKLEGGLKEFDIIVSCFCNIARFSTFFDKDYDIPQHLVYKIYKSIKKRLSFEPLSWVLESHQFLDININVKKGVFVPRPETEYLAIKALDLSRKFKNPKILDYCAGSGVIGLYIAYKNKSSFVFAIDKSKRAFNVMIENKNKFKLNNFTPILSSSIKYVKNFLFDIIISNPPYIPNDMYKNLDETVRKEPKSALFGGNDGLDMFRYISFNIHKVLKPGGFFIAEIGEYYSNEIVKIFKFVSDSVKIVKDINGKDRYIEVLFNGMFHNRRSKYCNR
ncbi:MAG: peptide chain release factor N(5)-glutamine methyltransferase [Elusimicrobiales bacterium]|nr:peptide chain release factor N(5)-glutamine methyltransferase [Elusimicrobiales bacterium]